MCEAWPGRTCGQDRGQVGARRSRVPSAGAGLRGIRGRNPSPCDSFGWETSSYICDPRAIAPNSKLIANKRSRFSAELHGFRPSAWREDRPSRGLRRARLCPDDGQQVPPRSRPAAPRSSQPACGAAGTPAGSPHRVRKACRFPSAGPSVLTVLTVERALPQAPREAPRAQAPAVAFGPDLPQPPAGPRDARQRALTWAVLGPDCGPLGVCGRRGAEPGEGVRLRASPRRLRPPPGRRGRVCTGWGPGVSGGGGGSARLPAPSCAFHRRERIPAPSVFFFR